MDGAFPNEPGRSFDSAGRGPRGGGGAGGRGFRGTAENAKVRLTSTARSCSTDSSGVRFSSDLDVICPCGIADQTVHPLDVRRLPVW